MLTVKNLSVKYGSSIILNNINFSINKNQWLMIVGPNGAGKSTIINAISQNIPYNGEVYFKVQDVSKIKPNKLAHYIGVLRQNYNVSYSYTVEEIVRLGRYSHTSKFLLKSDENEELIIKNAMELTGMLPFANKSILNLSGGELQRTFLAQIFAQEPELIILDEPTNHLDLVFQKQVFELVGHWAKEPGHAVISVVHDLNLARSYGTDALLLDKGNIVSFGKKTEVLNKENLEHAYGMDVYSWMKQMFLNWEM